MTKDTLSALDDLYDPLMPAAPMIHAAELSLTPLMFGAAWCNHMMQAYLPEPPLARALARRPAYHDPHAQLVIPAPLESAGEGALLA